MQTNAETILWASTVPETHAFRFVAPDMHPPALWVICPLPTAATSAIRSQNCGHSTSTPEMRSVIKGMQIMSISIRTLYPVYIWEKRRYLLMIRLVPMIMRNSKKLWGSPLPSQSNLKPAIPLTIRKLTPHSPATMTVPACLSASFSLTLVRKRFSRFWMIWSIRFLKM